MNNNLGGISIEGVLHQLDESRRVAAHEVSTQFSKQVSVYDKSAHCFSLPERRLVFGGF